MAAMQGRNLQECRRWRGTEFGARGVSCGSFAEAPTGKTCQRPILLPAPAGVVCACGRSKRYGLRHGVPFWPSLIAKGNSIGPKRLPTAALPRPKKGTLCRPHQEGQRYEVDGCQRHGTHYPSWGLETISLICGNIPSQASHYPSWGLETCRPSAGPPVRGRGSYTGRGGSANSGCHLHRTR